MNQRCPVVWTFAGRVKLQSYEVPISLGCKKLPKGIYTKLQRERSKKWAGFRVIYLANSSYFSRWYQCTIQHVIPSACRDHNIAIVVIDTFHDRKKNYHDTKQKLYYTVKCNKIMMYCLAKKQVSAWSHHCYKHNRPTVAPWQYWQTNSLLWS